jgi:uncharacterized protein
MQNGVQTAGAILGMWRYPVKSMQGEEINASLLTEQGLLGDRTYALVDADTGKVVSAKNPRKWPHMFAFRAEYVEPPEMHEGPPPVRITMPEGKSILSSQSDVDGFLSEALGARVSLQRSPLPAPRLEEYWPDVEELAHREEVTDEAMPAGTFFDSSIVHILTTATLNQLRRAYPQGAFEVCRFRPNLLVAPGPNMDAGFVENEWVGRTLAIGDQVRLKVTCATGRCVMTTLAQGDLPRDIDILKTAVRANGSNVGVYATVERGGLIRAGDTVKIITSE